MFKRFTDQMGQVIELAHPPQRIISLVPSQTELLCDLGLADKVVGITRFCVHPKNKFLSTPRIGGTKNLDFDKIAALQPDLIIGNKEENEREQIERLKENYPVWMSDIFTLEDAFEMIMQVSEMLGQNTNGQNIVKKIKSGFAQINKAQKPRKVAYFIWKKPYMLAGKNTFIHHMLSQMGLENCTDELRYPEITLEQLKVLNPEVIFLSSEPYPFKDKDVQEMKFFLPNTKVLIVDGEMFSWYGSRLMYSAAHFNKLIKELEL